MRRHVDASVSPYVPGALVAALVLVSAVAQGLFLLGTDEAELLTEWLPDDAYYYLLPAWNAGHGAGFSFDGVAPSYGFQPLWGCILAVLATLTGTKTGFVTTVLLLGSALHLCTGALLHRCFTKWGMPWGGVVAAATWLLNPDLVRVQATGMESGIVGVLLLATLLRLPEKDAHLTPRDAAVLGILGGLLFLARVSLLPATLLAAWFTWRASRGRGLLAFAAAASLVALPWLVFASFTFGQPLPVSGTRKLVGGLAGLARLLASIPGVPDGLVLAGLPERERLLFSSEGLAWPSWSRLWALGPRATAGWTLGHWLPSGLGAKDAIRGIALISLAVPAALLWRGRQVRAPRGLLVLAAVAVVNGLAHHLLLNAYVHYCYWYRVPEMLLLTAIVGMVLAPAVEAPSRAVRAAAATVPLIGALGLVTTLLPRTFDPQADRYAIGVLSVAEAMNASLPAGTVVGSWNAGLLGWVSDGPRVVNLDGFSNERAFLAVAEAEVLYRSGYGHTNPTLDWLDRQGVGWLVDLHPLTGLGSTPFYDLIPPERYVPTAHSAPITHWARTDRDHTVALVRLTPAP